MLQGGGQEKQASAGVARSKPLDIIHPTPVANIDPALVLPRNLSHEGSSFHLHHYFPQQSLQKARQREEQLTTKKALFKTKRYISCPASSPQQQQQTAATAVLQGRFAIRTTSKGTRALVSLNAGSPAAVAGPTHTAPTTAATAMADGVASNSQESYSSDSKLKLKNGLGGSSSSTGSGEQGYLSDTDTNYSEDYTQMTEVGEGSDLGGRTPPGSFTSDLDSPSAGSDGGWSSSTLSEGGVSPECPYVSKAKANIKLLLAQSPDDDDNGDDDDEVECATSPVDEEPSDPGFKETMTPSDSTNTLFEDREFDFLKTEPVRRSTSLKTYKTPPGTPHKKKAVRFADALGLDLESVRHILNLEDPPTVPKSAMKDLKVGLEEEHRTEGTKYLAAYFGQPGVDPNFFAKVQDQKVVLENCRVDDKDMTISGTCRVANIAYHKKVIVRYSINNWLTFEDVCASYVQNSNDGATDRFSFNITVPQYFSVGSRLAFALMFSANGATFWDNNSGQNYVIGCYAKAVPTHPSDSTWMHFL